MTAAAASLRFLQRTAAPILPAAIKRSIGRAYGEATRAGVLRSLRALARGREPIVAGPWLGEVGFELLYWIPFLTWAAERFEIAPERLIVMSRGGTRDWYGPVASRYHDAFECVSPDEFRARNNARVLELGEQKQGSVTAFDDELLGPVLRELGVDARRVLHPALMYRIFRPYWWGHAGLEWVERHTRYRSLPPPPGFDLLSSLLAGYVAVKFYYNDSFPALPGNRAVARDVLHALRDQGPVVSLSTGLALDDHEAWEEEETLTAHGIKADLSPALNLALQAAVVARARAWVGTYGGFAYLAPFYGVPSTAYYSDRHAFSQRHLQLAEHVFRRFSDAPMLTLRDAASS